MTRRQPISDARREWLDRVYPNRGRYGVLEGGDRAVTPRAFWHTCAGCHRDFPRGGGVLEDGRVVCSERCAQHLDNEEGVPNASDRGALARLAELGF